tara:strand:- start:3331 stop:4530 length:1200 start_codon:yes stop_codon:yes gene_type:complete
MPRNRIIYQSEALYAGPSPATGYHYLSGTTPVANVGINTVGYTSRVKQLQRIQTANYSFNIARQDVNQFGELAAIDRVILESPTVSLDTSYILGSLENESLLGFSLTPSGSTAVFAALSGILNKTEDERNYFIKTVPEGSDALGGSDVLNPSTTVNTNVIGIGNGFISSYTTEASVGDFPTASVSVEGLNMAFSKGVSGNYIPAVTPTDGSKITDIYYALPSGQSNNNVSGVSALRPGDITLSFYPNGSTTEMGGFTGVSITDAKIQSYSLSFDLARDPLQKLGSRFAFAREITFPVTVTCTVDANLGDLYTGSLADVLDADSAYDINLKLNAPGTAGAAAAAASDNVMARYVLKKCKIDSQEYTSDIGSNKAISMTFSAQIGGPAQTDVGLFISGLAH